MKDRKLTYGYVYNLPEGSLVTVAASGVSQVSWLEAGVFEVSRSDDCVYLLPVSISDSDKRNFKSKGLSVLCGIICMKPPKVSDNPEDINPSREEVYCDNQRVWFEESPVSREEIPSVHCGDVIKAKFGCIDLFGRKNPDNEELAVGIVRSISWFDKRFCAEWFSQGGYWGADYVAWSDAVKVDGCKNLISIAKEGNSK